MANINYFKFVAHFCFPILSEVFLKELQQRSGCFALATLAFTGYTKKNNQTYILVDLYT